MASAGKHHESCVYPQRLCNCRALWAADAAVLREALREADAKWDVLHKSHESAHEEQNKLADTLDRSRANAAVLRRALRRVNDGHGPSPSGHSGRAYEYSREDMQTIADYALTNTSAGQELLDRITQLESENTELRADVTYMCRLLGLDYAAIINKHRGGGAKPNGGNK